MGKKHAIPVGCVDVAVPDISGDFLQGVLDYSGFTTPDNAEYTFKCERNIRNSNLSDKMRRSYLAYSVGRKFLDVHDKDGATRRRLTALGKFSAAEAQCHETNIRFLSGYRPSSPICFGTENSRLIGLAEKIITDLLGEFDLNEFIHGCAYGPGATTSVPSRQTSLWAKYLTTSDSSTGCFVYVDAYLKFNELRGDFFKRTGIPSYKCRDTNKVITVAKDSKTDRVIAIEPDWNMFFQKGIGWMIRKRLRRVGIDLNDQRPNQELSRIGSISGDYATIDLSMASDTLSLEVVKRLIPTSWLTHLEQLRCHAGSLPSGTVFPYSKFSSMGNGFTFELESLIFWALCRAVAIVHKAESYPLLVYGDDIVCHSTIFHPIVDLLEICGFATNVEKSFSVGGFRESCGKHWFMGEDITPFYLRVNLDTIPECFKMANAVKQYAKLGWGHDGLLKGLYDLTVSNIPLRYQKFRIPEGYGDIGLVSEFDEATPRVIKGGFFRAYHVKGLVRTTKVHHPRDEVGMIADLSYKFHAPRVSDVVANVSRPGDYDVDRLGV